MSISLCMIVKNEEEFLEQCLNSVKDLVDEIIIVDTGSTDKTKEIAIKFTNKIFDFKWSDDFSEARNFSLQKTTKEWILVLDADEIIARKDIKKIKELINNNNKIDAYQLEIRNYKYDSSYSNWVTNDYIYKESKDFPGWVSIPLVRLFRNNKGYKFQNKIHEIIQNSIQEKKGNISNSKIPIHHYGFIRKNINKKKDKYLELGKKQIKEKPKDPKAYYEIGLIYLRKKQFKKAHDYFNKVIELDDNYPSVHSNLGAVYLEQELYYQAIEEFKKTIKQNPNNIGAYSNLSIAYLKLNKFDKAAELLEKAITLNPDDPELYNNLGVLFYQTKNYEAAIDMFNQSLKLNPYKTRAIKNLAIIYFKKKKKIDKAIEFYKRLIKLEKNSKNYCSLGVLYFNKKNIQKAEYYFKKAVELDKNNLEAYNNLAIIFENKKELKKAINYFKKTIELEHPNKDNILKKNRKIIGKKMSISLCMIVKNEEQFIAKCLNSVKELVDEFIIIDTGSKDKTIEIIKSLNLNNLKIIKFKWVNDFSKARNESLKYTTKDWILVLDSDETISKKDHDKIRELTKKDNTAYFLIQRNYTNNASVMGWQSSKEDSYEESKQFSGWLPNPIIRLFQNKKRIYFVDPVHEHVGESIKKINGKVKHSNIPIHHFYQLKKKEEKEKKGQMYLEIGEKKIIEKDPKFFYELGVQHQDLGEFEKATEYFKKAIKINPKYIKAYINLGANLIKLNKIEHAKKILITAQKIDPNNADIYNNLGIVFSKKKKNK